MKTLYEWWSLGRGGIELFFFLCEAGSAQRGGDDNGWRQEWVVQMNQ